MINATDLTVEREFDIGGADTVEIRLVRNESHLIEVGRFRYEEHVVRLRKPALHADVERGVLVEPLDSCSTNIVARCCSKIIGAVRITLRPTFATQVPWMVPALPDEPILDCSYVSRLLVSERLRGSAVARELFLAAFRLGAPIGIQHCYIYAAPRLVRFYERWGFVPLNPITHPDDGEQIAMALTVRDLHHLGRVRSPFVTTATMLMQALRSASGSSEPALPPPANA